MSSVPINSQKNLMKSSRFGSPTYMREEESLSQFETFDDLLSEHTLRGSQTSFHTLCTLDKDAPRSTSFEKLLESLSKDLLSTTKDSEEMDSLLLDKNHDFFVKREEDVSKYAPTFCTAGKKIAVVPKQTSLNFVQSLFPIENEGNTEVDLKIVNEKHNIQSSLVVNASEENLHNKCALRKSLNLKMKESLASSDIIHQKRPSGINESNQHQDEQTLCNSLDMAGCSIEFHDLENDFDSLCESVPWKHIYDTNRFNGKLDNVRKSFKSFQQPDSTSGETLAGKEGEKRIFLKKRKIATDWQAYYSDPAQKMIHFNSIKQDEIFAKEKNEHQLQNQVQKKPSGFSKHVKSLSIKILDFLETRRKETRKDFVTYESRDIIPETAREELTYCDSLFFLLSNIPNEPIDRNSELAQKYSVWKKYTHIGFPYLEYDLEHIQESIRLNLKMYSSHNIKIAFVITHFFTLHRSLFNKAKRCSKNLFFLKFVNRLLQSTENHRVTEELRPVENLFQGFLFLFQKIIETNNEFHIALPCQFFILQSIGWSFNAQYPQITRTKCWMVYETQDMLKETFISKNKDNKVCQVLHWFVVTDGHRLAVAAFPDKSYQKITFGTVIRSLCFTVHPVNTVQLSGDKSLLKPLLSCCLNCSYSTFCFIKKTIAPLPPLGIVPKPECLSFLNTSNTFGQTRRHGSLKGIILRVFPLCIQIKEITFHNITTNIHLLNLTCDLFSKQHGVDCSEASTNSLPQTMVLLIDARLLQDLYNILKQNDMNMTLEVFHEWMLKFHKMCSYLTLKNLSIEDYYKLQRGRHIFVSSTLKKRNCSRPQPGLSETNFGVPRAFQTTVMSHIELFEELPVWKKINNIFQDVLATISINEDYGSTLSDNFMYKARILQLLGFCVFFNNTTFNAVVQRKNNSLRNLLFPTKLFQHWYYDIIGVPIIHFYRESLCLLDIFLLSFLGIVRIQIRKTTDSDIPYLECLHSYLCNVPEASSLRVKHVQFIKVTQATGYNFQYQKDEYPTIVPNHLNTDDSKTLYPCFISTFTAHICQMDIEKNEISFASEIQLNVFVLREEKLLWENLLVT